MLIVSIGRWVLSALAASALHAPFAPVAVGILAVHIRVVFELAWRAIARAQVAKLNAFLNRVVFSERFIHDHSLHWDAPRTKE
jgi:hypothetical protein